MEHHPNGRHRKPCRSLAGRLWALTATALAVALAYVFVPPTPARERERTAITPPPRRREPPPAPAQHHPPVRHGDAGDPDEIAGALVRPYMLPFPRLPQGDLLAIPAPAPTAPAAAEDLSDLADAVRRYLHRVG
ncbi:MULTISPECIES: hypothetical protein [unclassified Nocardiopsis]|uniref:hypothetical protein n=1 Tax=unclassified Nocardiopsis TaxID=2649073 RepID=UPI001F3B76EC|nr:MULTISPECIES: hypothetical protein [unclassified Nocardiopsis]